MTVADFVNANRADFEHDGRFALRATLEHS